MSADTSSDQVPKAVAAHARKTIAAKKGRMLVSEGRYDTTTLHWIYGHALKSAARKMSISSKDLEAIETMFTALKPELSEAQVDAVEHICFRTAGLLAHRRATKEPRAPKKNSLREFLDKMMPDWRTETVATVAQYLQKTNRYGHFDLHTLCNNVRSARKSGVKKLVG